MRFRLQNPRHLRSLTQISGGVLFVFLLWLWTRCGHGVNLLQMFGGRNRDPSVHLILASRLNVSYEWVANLTIPNLKIVPYMANDENAVFHPDDNKGNEAMIYLTYLADFYEELPDISIFTHGQDYAWHVDVILEESTLYALNRLDLSEVLRRQYLNLRISWENACPDWMHTNVGLDSEEYNVDLKAEEPFMKASFEELFPNNTVPEILAQPCCSQFAVTKEAIRTIPREQYAAAITWLEDSYLPDALSGRVWEHLWQYMFLKKAVDCPDERTALCMSYHICFQEQQDWEDWKYFGRNRQTFRDLRSNLMAEGFDENFNAIQDVDKNIRETEENMDRLKAGAIELGNLGEVRKAMLVSPEIK